MVAVNPLEQINLPEVRDFLFTSLDLGDPVRTARDESRCLFLEIPTRDNVKLTARIFEGNPEDPHLLYLPAEYENLDTLALLGEGLKKLGFTFASLDYRGFGMSGGKPSMGRLFEDTEIFYEGVRDWMKKTGRAGDAVVMGRSLGSAAALDLAVKHEKELLCLILESAFNRSRDYLSRKGVAEGFIPQGPVFQNGEKMSSFTRPVLFIHSPRDQVQTLTEVEWLVVKSRSKATQFQIAPSGTREDLATQVGDLYLEFVHQYVNLRRGVRPKRRKKPRRRNSG